MLMIFIHLLRFCRVLGSEAQRIAYFHQPSATEAIRSSASSSSEYFNHWGIYLAIQHAVLQKWPTLPGIPRRPRIVTREPHRVLHQERLIS